MKVKLITHTDFDGVGCAILAKHVFGEANVNVTFCDYSDMPNVVKPAVEAGLLYDRVFITDLNLPQDIVDYIDGVNKYNRILLFDHHIQSLPYNNFSWVTAREFNDSGAKTCGTELFYNYLKNNQAGFIDTPVLQQFVKYVNYYDTWVWQNNGADGDMAKKLNDLLYIYGRYTFIYKMLHYLSKSVVKYSLSSIDRVVTDVRDREIQEYIDAKDKQLKIVKVEEYTVGVVFAERFTSQLGNELCRRHSEIDFVAMICPEYSSVSFRTVKDIDLSEFAARYGGGGHKAAAGMQIDTDKLDNFVEDIFARYTEWPNI